jgi:ABC-2 type transport system permease protein
MGPVFRLTLRQVSGRWRLAILTVLALLPVVIAVVTLATGDAPSVSEFEMLVLSTMLAGSITPMVVLAIGAVAFANELEDRTLANLTITPLPRWKIVLPKLLATIAVAAPFVAASAALTAHAAFLGDQTATIAVTVAALAAVAMYAAAFTWLGLVSPQAIGIGLLYIVLWEGFFSGFISGVRLLSIRHYAIAVMHGLDPRRFAAHDHLPLAVAVALTVAVTVGFTLLTVRRLRRMDVP